MEQYKLFINGEFVDAASGKCFESIDPGTGMPIAEIAMAGKEDAEAAIAAARHAFDRGDWSGLRPEARMAKMQDFADQISQQMLRLAATEAMDSGQILKLAGFAPLLGIGFGKRFCTGAGVYTPGAHRCMRGHHPLELSYDHGFLEDRTRPDHG